MKFSSKATTLITLQGFMSKLDSLAVKNDEKLKEFIRRLVMSFEWLNEFHFSNENDRRGYFYREGALSQGAKFASRLRPQLERVKRQFGIRFNR